MTERQAQVDRVAAILERDGYISNLYAIQSHLSYRLGARIHELRHERGYVIRTDTDDTGNAVYVLLKRPEPKQLSFV